MERGLAFGNIIGKSKAIMEVKRLIAEISNSSSSVLIEGETGTGKELVARAIYALSPRKDKPFEVINCSGLQDTLVESEMFGDTKGAFTGAFANKAGLFETCNGGTVFLDEISILSPQAQAKFLRVLENGEIRRLGSNVTIKIDVRIIAATNVDLSAEVRQGRFRDDLYYRLKRFLIKIPPLRKRKEDIPLLVDHFLKFYSRKEKKEIVTMSDDAFTLLTEYEWPGNVRELENALAQAIIRCPAGTSLTSDLFVNFIKPDKPLAETLIFDKTGSLKVQQEEFERRTIQKALEKSGGSILKAAQILGMTSHGLRKAISRLGIKTQ